MNAWVLSLIVCAATPAADGSYCTATPLQFGLSREACRQEIGGGRDRASHTRLECTNDPGLTAALIEREARRAAEPGLSRPTF